MLKLDIIEAEQTVKSQLVKGVVDGLATQDVIVRAKEEKDIDTDNSDNVYQ